MAQHKTGVEHPKPLKVYSDSLEGEFYYDPEGHALHPVTDSYHRKNFEEYYHIDPVSHKVRAFHPPHNKEEHRIRWNELHPVDPTRPSHAPELQRANGDAPVFPPGRGSQHAPPPGHGRTPGYAPPRGIGPPSPNGHAQVQIVPAVVHASARQLHHEGDSIRSVSPDIASVTVSPTASVFDLQLPSFSNPGAEHVRLRGDEVIRTSEQLNGVGSGIVSQDANAAASLKV
jgi:hypothetical protein